MYISLDVECGNIGYNTKKYHAQLSNCPVIADISYSILFCLIPFAIVVLSSFRTRHVQHRPASVADKDADGLGEKKN